MTRNVDTEAEPSVIRAAGGVLWRDAGDDLEIVVVHRPRYDDWTLPKGKVDPGEHPAVTARREVLEETGSSGVLGRALAGQRYQVTGPGGVLTDKVVDFWAMHLDPHAPAGEGDGWPEPDEIDEVRWVTPAAGRRLLTRQTDRQTLASFASVTPRTTTIALVRHGSAGNKRKWAGTDDHRPLDARGRHEADRVASVLPGFGPRRVVSAPVTRCIATVQPIASALGIPIEMVAAFGEDANPEDAAPAHSALAALVAAGRPTVVCSQGGVIPQLVADLTLRDGVAVREISTRKGSVWVLSFAADRLVAADYLEDLAPVRP